MKAIVLAAGYAMRLYPLTKDRPKALLPIGGRAMMDYLIDQIAEISEIDEVFLVSNHRFATQFRQWAEAAPAVWPRLTFHVLDDGTDSNETRLGAVGDIQFALEQGEIDQDVLIAASDNFFTFSLDEFVDTFRRFACDTILGKHLGEGSPDLKRFAVAQIDASGRVTSLVEKPQQPQSDIAVYALYLYRQDTLPLIRQYLAEGNNPDAPGHFPEWLYPRKRVQLHLFEGECVDIGTHEAYQEICKQMESSPKG